MKIMVVNRRRSGCYGPTAATLSVLWDSTADPSTCYVTITTQITADNPCGESYAVSLYGEVWYYTVDISDGVLVWTGDPESHTIPPGGPTVFYPDTLGPIPISVADAQLARVIIYVTWPDSTVTSFFYDNYTAACG